MLLTVAMPVQLPKMQFFNKQGKPLVGGKIYSYKVGTGEFKPTFKNAQKTALNRNPVVLDGAGCAFIYFNGNHHLKIFDKNDQFIEERWVPSTEFRTFFFDKFGKALKFGKVYTHDFESTILKPSYQNPEKTVRNTNPVILDEDGSAMMCMNGSYRLRVYDEKGVFQGDQDFFRNVAYALTSKPYPVYLDESLATSVNLQPAKENSAETETVNTSISILSVSVREASNSININDNINTSISILSATVEQQRSKYQNTEMEKERLSTHISILSANITKTVGFINYTMKPDPLLLEIAIISAQITNQE